MRVALNDALSLLALNKADFNDKSPNQCWDIICSAYKAKIVECHPAKPNQNVSDETFRIITEAFHALTLLHQSSTLTKALAIPSNQLEAEFTKAPKYYYLDLREAMLHSLLGYYMRRYGHLPPSDDIAFNMVRLMFYTILGISPLLYDINYQANCGYIIRSYRPDIIQILKTFLTTIQDADITNLKSQASEYFLSLSKAQELIGKTEYIIHPDIISKHIRTITGNNHTNVYTSYDRERQQYQVWLKPSVKYTTPEVLGQIITPPSNNKNSPDIATPSSYPKPKNFDAELHSTNVQLCFVMDATSSMTAAIDTAKNALREAGASIELATSTIPQMSFISYHDYGDRNESAPEKIKNWDWQEYKRFVQEEYGEGFAQSCADELIAMQRMRRKSNPPPMNNVSKSSPVASSSANIQPPASTNKLSLLNYPGLYDPKPYPKFTTPDQICAQLDSVVASGGGGDIAEMLEAALVAAACLPWNKPVEDMYIVTDGPMHDHWSGSFINDAYDTKEKIIAAQTLPDKANNIPALNQTHPVLQDGIYPEDWVTQIILLARKGVKINMLVNSEEHEILFMATFIATITSGEVFLMKDWSKMESIIVENTSKSCIEAGITTNNPQMKSDNSTRHLKPAPVFLHHVYLLLSGLDLDAIFNNKTSATIPEEKERIKILAQQIRNKYSNAMVEFKGNQSSIISGIDTSKIGSTIKEKILENRKIKTPKLLAQKSNPGSAASSPSFFAGNSNQNNNNSSQVTKSPPSSLDDSFSLF